MSMPSASDADYPASAYNLFDHANSPISNTPTETSKIPTVSAAISSAGTLWHKDNPLLILAVILAVTIGAASVSASGHVGKAKATLELGDPK